MNAVTQTAPDTATAPRPKPAAKGEPVFTAPEMKAMRDQVAAIMEAEDLSQADVARQTGIAPATFHAWYRGNYEGNNDRVATTVQVWLTSREEQKRAASRVPKPPSFIATPTAEEIHDALRYAQVMPEITVVAGGVGLGKTVSCRRYQVTNPNVWMATMDPSTSGVHGMLSELVDVMGVTEKSASKLARAIGRKIEGSGGLIVIDEAQHLDTKALDQLRSLYDRYDVGIALVGNETVYARLEGEGRKAMFAQLFSRIGVRVTRARPRANDICRLIAAWNVTDKEMVRFLKAIAGKPGALRSMTKVLQVAKILSAGADEEMSIAHLKAAYAKHTPSTVNE